MNMLLTNAFAVILVVFFKYSHVQANCECGKKYSTTNPPTREKKGPFETEIYKYPWQALFLARDENFNEQLACGGALVSRRFVATTVCIFDPDSSQRYSYDVYKFTVRLGEHDISTSRESETQDFQIKKVITHFGYKRGSFDYDKAIVLVELDKQARLGPTVVPICLVSNFKKPKFSINDTFTITGIGYSIPGESVRGVASEANLTYIAKEVCEENMPVWYEYLYKNNPDLSNRMLCAIPTNRNTCVYKFGDAIVQRMNGTDRYILRGLYATGTSCDSIMLSIDAPRFTDWIVRNTNYEACVIA